MPRRIPLRPDELELLKTVYHRRKVYFRVSLKNDSCGLRYQYIIQSIGSALHFPAKEEKDKLEEWAGTLYGNEFADWIEVATSSRDDITAAHVAAKTAEEIITAAKIRFLESIKVEKGSDLDPINVDTEVYQLRINEGNLSEILGLIFEPN